MMMMEGNQEKSVLVIKGSFSLTLPSNAKILPSRSGHTLSSSGSGGRGSSSSGGGGGGSNSDQSKVATMDSQVTYYVPVAMTPLCGLLLFLPKVRSVDEVDCQLNDDPNINSNNNNSSNIEEQWLGVNPILNLWSFFDLVVIDTAASKNGKEATNNTEVNVKRKENCLSSQDVVNPQIKKDDNSGRLRCLTRKENVTQLDAILQKDRQLSLMAALSTDMHKM
jgi:hypothetical protein